MRVFISGGCKNGKSSFAQQLVKEQMSRPLYYIATMKAADGEDSERIVLHRKEREGMGFNTIEQYKGIEGILDKSDHRGCFLLDSLTALLVNEMFSPTGDFDSTACERVSTGLMKIMDKLENIVVVSDYIYGDAELYDPLTESYRRSLATLDRLMAQQCDVVLEASYTKIIVHKTGVKREIY